MKRLNGKVAIVTGGALGLGRSHSIRLASEGATVVVTDINEKEGRQTVSLIEQAGGSALFLRHDVAKEADWISVTEQTVSRYGKIDVLVNNAGILLLKTIQDTTVEEWDRMFSINTTGVFLGCKSVLSGMKKAGGGSIINVSSIVGYVGFPGAAAYVATKGAVRLLTKAAAVDFAPYKVRVNSIHPGFVKTEMTKDILSDPGIEKAALGPTLLGRAADVSEISNAVLFLASDESSYMDGSELVIDGGYTAA